MLRVLLFLVLGLGAARLGWMVSRQPGALDALGGESNAQRLDSDDLDPLATWLLREATPGLRVHVVDTDTSAYDWLRYLAYPRRIDFLPPGPRSEFLLDVVSQPGERYLVFPLARATEDLSAKLVARADGAQAERVLVQDGAYAVYRVRR